MIVNIHAAKTNLSKLIARAEAGEEVIIANAGKPVARLTPVRMAEARGTLEPDALPSWMGSLRGKIWISPDIDAVEAEIAKEMEESPIFPRQAPDR
ncbi:MAG: type II toxin-antitoxin system Phd/YefM family antitoxin [Caulobacteraceae bacterium]